MTEEEKKKAKCQDCHYFVPPNCTHEIFSGISPSFVDKHGCTGFVARVAKPQETDEIDKLPVNPRPTGYQVKMWNPEDNTFPLYRVPHQEEPGYMVFRDENQELVSPRVAKMRQESQDDEAIMRQFNQVLNAEGVYLESPEEAIDYLKKLDHSKIIDILPDQQEDVKNNQERFDSEVEIFLDFLPLEDEVIAKMLWEYKRAEYSPSFRSDLANLVPCCRTLKDMLKYELGNILVVRKIVHYKKQPFLFNGLELWNFCQHCGKPVRWKN